MAGAGLPVALWPERFTTASAHAARKHFGGKGSGDKSWADEAAAVLILQDYLDWRREKLQRGG
jgi:RNase H-fold protein (predicted Holliday junction resolvase)